MAAKKQETGGGRELAFAALQMIEARDAYADIVLDKRSWPRGHPPTATRSGASPAGLTTLPRPRGPRYTSSADPFTGLYRQILIDGGERR